MSGVQAGGKTDVIKAGHEFGEAQGLRITSNILLEVDEQYNMIIRLSGLAVHVFRWASPKQIKALPYMKEDIIREDALPRPYATIHLARSSLGTSSRATVQTVPNHLLQPLQSHSRPCSRREQQLLTDLQQMLLAYMQS